jgi:hypothetical protein
MRRPVLRCTWGQNGDDELDFRDELMRRRRDPRAVVPFIASDMRRIRRAIVQGGPVEAA